MKKQDIANQIARQSGVTRAVAADRVDGVFNQILSDVRRGGWKTLLPGIGTFSHNTDGRSLFEREWSGGVPNRFGRDGNAESR